MRERKLQVVLGYPVSKFKIIIFASAEKLVAENGGGSQANGPAPTGELRGERFTLSLTKGTQVCTNKQRYLFFIIIMRE